MQINYKTKEEYKNGNAQELANVQAMKGYKQGEWLTFLQAKELGLSIIKGSKGVHLVRVFDTDKSDSAGKPKTAIKGFTVFNIEQTELKEDNK